jgi:N-acetyl-anhydromuramyl-L-alanine amidase AmpD
MPNKNLIDWTDLTGPTSGLDLLGNSIRDGLKTDTYEGRTRFVAIALTNMWPMTSQQTAGIDAASVAMAGTSAGNSNRRFAFKGRVLGSDSPHLFLPNPCNPDFVDLATGAAAWNIISMHTTFVTANVANPPAIAKGDIVYVELEKTENAYNLQYGIALETAEVQDKPPSVQQFCDTMNKLFDTSNPATMGGGPAAGVSTSAPTGVGTGIYNYQTLPNGCWAKLQPSPSKALPETIVALPGAGGFLNHLDWTTGRGGWVGNKTWFTRIVTHYSVGDSAEKARKALCKRKLDSGKPIGLSYHFIIDINGQVTQLVDLRQQGQHAMPGNSDSIGICLVGMGYAREDDTKPSRSWPPNYKETPKITVADLRKYGDYSSHGFTNPNQRINADPNGMAGGPKNWYPEPSGLWYPEFTTEQIEALYIVVQHLKDNYSQINKIVNHSMVQNKFDAGASLTWAGPGGSWSNPENSHMQKLKDIVGDPTAVDYLGGGKTSPMAGKTLP